MQNNLYRIIFIGDVIGKFGRKFLGLTLPLIRKKYSPDLIVANGENSAGGLGITRKTAGEIYNAGVQVITGGNHIWDKKEALGLLNDDKRIIRPMNFPRSAPGSGCHSFKTKDGCVIQILSLQGRVFMEPVVDNPFLVVDEFLDNNKADISLIDFHAEATAEKQAMGFFLDGRVSAVLGTHTHVQTSDLRILDKGTAYQSDVGMTGSLDSVIGMRIEPVLQKFLTGINHRFEVEKKNLILDMTVMDFDKNSGKAIYVEPVRIHETHYQEQLDILN